MINQSVGGYRVTGWWSEYANTYIIELSKLGECVYGPVRLIGGDQAIAYKIRANVAVGDTRRDGDIENADITFYTV